MIGIGLDPKFESGGAEEMDLILFYGNILTYLMLKHCDFYHLVKIQYSNNINLFGYKTKFFHYSVIST
jgi:hypothetical protein